MFAHDSIAPELVQVVAQNEPKSAPKAKTRTRTTNQNNLKTSTNTSTNTNTDADVMNTDNEKMQQDWQLSRKYTLSEVQQHCSLDDCWMVIFDKVYNITEFVNDHPGGDFILLEYAGRDATHPFLSSRHGSAAYKMLDKYWIGILVDEELYYSNNSSYCSVYSNLSWRSSVPTLEEQPPLKVMTTPVAVQQRVP
jgi:cytochrome b involved in lipid metabolism